MTEDPVCRNAVAALIDSIESGIPMNEQQRAHLQECARCRELLDSAKQFQSALGENGLPELANMAQTSAVAEQEVNRSRKRLSMKRIAAALILLITMGLLVIFPMGEAGIAVLIAITALLVLAIPILVIAVAADTIRPRGNRLYKRLRPGKQLSGVCLGLAEAFGIDVSIIRIIFLALLFFKGLGFWLYLVLDLVMPMHPADREHLLRFRIRRWWESFRGREKTA